MPAQQITGTAVDVARDEHVAHDAVRGVRLTQIADVVPVAVSARCLSLSNTSPASASSEIT